MRVAALDRRANALDRTGHVAEEERVVTRKLRVEKAAGKIRVVVPPAREDCSGHLAELELA